MGKQWKQWQALFSCVSKITADGDWSHEIQRHLLLGRKTMTNLDSILKSRDINLPTQVHLVKASPLDCKEIKPVSPKGNQSWIFIGRTMLKFQYFSHLMRRTDSLEKPLMPGKIKGRSRRGWQRMRQLDGITNSMDMSLGKFRSWWWTGKPGMLQSMGSQSRTQLSNLTEVIQNETKIWNLRKTLDGSLPWSKAEQSSCFPKPWCKKRQLPKLWLKS